MTGSRIDGAVAEVTETTGGEGNGNGTSAADAAASGESKGATGGSSRRQQVFDIRVFCVGTRPLLMNQFTKEKLVDILIFGKKDVPDRESPLRDRAAKTVFRDRDGNPVIPTDSILSCLCAGGCNVPLKGRTNLSKAGGKDSMVPNFLSILDEGYVRLLLPDGTPTTDSHWEDDVRRGAMQEGKTPCAIVRARFDRWAFILNARVDLSKVTGLTIRTVRKLIDEAGSSKGLCGFRKSFGRFTVADGGWIETPVDESRLVRPKAPAGFLEAIAAREGS